MSRLYLRKPAGLVADSRRLLLATQVSHTLTALRAALREIGVEADEQAPGMLEATTSDVPTLVRAVRSRLSSVEAAEVHAVQLVDQHGPALVAAALGATTLAQLGARAEHADLLPLFADEGNAFRSVYQPIVALGDASTPTPDDPAKTGDYQVIGYEALLRATGPTGPLLPPALFGAAEQAGWLHVLDRIGRTTALRGAAGWLGTDLLFVNFLPTSIYRPQVCLRTTEQAAFEAGLRLEQLVFEVTESERVTDLDHLADVFAYYRDQGCKVALDDLGAGYSSLNMLVQLKPDVVKLDKDLVQRLPDKVSAAVVTAVVDITHSYGGLVLAECVETAEQAAAARDLGVDLGQGWHFGRPQEKTPLPVATKTKRPRKLAELSRWPAGPVFDGNDPAVALPAPETSGTESAGGTAPAAASASQPAASGATQHGPSDVEALLAGAVQVSSVGITIADATIGDMPLIYVNDAFELRTGYHAPEVLGRDCRLLQGPGTDPVAVRELGDAIRVGREHVSVLQNYRKDGTPWWNELRVSPLRNSRGEVTHYFGFQNDVTDRVEAEHQVAHMAYYDQLTDLPNRLHLLRTLEKETARALAEGTSVAVLFLDLDGFKAVNDRYGHAIGDLTLTAAAACLRGALRENDLLVRYSGDEFVVVLTGVPPDTAQRVAQRTADAVVGSLITPLQVSGEDVQLGASVGVAIFPDHGRTPEELLQAADRAMYAAKQTGRGQAVLASLSPHASEAAQLP